MAIPQDVSKLSYAELQKLIAEVNEQIARKRVEEIKVLADAYAKKAVASGFSVKEAIEALKPYLPKRTTRSAPAVVKYRDPADSKNTWSGKGRPPSWLREYIDAGKNKDSFLAS